MASGRGIINDPEFSKFSQADDLEVGSTTTPAGLPGALLIPTLSRLTVVKEIRARSAVAEWFFSFDAAAPADKWFPVKIDELAVIPLNDAHKKVYVMAAAALAIQWVAYGFIAPTSPDVTP